MAPLLFSGHVVIVCSAKELPGKTDRSSRIINPHAADFIWYTTQREKKLEAELKNAARFVPDIKLLYVAEI
jgi:hypothetical protein